jgi:hypothetical protein
MVWDDVIALPAASHTDTKDRGSRLVPLSRNSVHVIIVKYLDKKEMIFERGLTSHRGYG